MDYEFSSQCLFVCEEGAKKITMYRINEDVSGDLKLGDVHDLVENT